jgi:pyrroloquinoline quinone biosynthesis protein D
VAYPADSSLPRLAKGCRWGSATEGEGTVLFPEGAIKVQGTGKTILERCDGQKTFAQVVDELVQLYAGAPAAQIREEAGKFLESLQNKRIVDY